MSADNGVYILKTGVDEKKEWRVAHLQAVENVNFNTDAEDSDYCSLRYTWTSDHRPDECPQCIALDKRYNSNNPDIQIKNARRMWKDCKVFHNETSALTEAKRIYDEIMADEFCPICEYGISEIVIPRVF
jgi:rubrerythrin